MPSYQTPETIPPSISGKPFNSQYRSRRSARDGIRRAESSPVAGLNQYRKSALGGVNNQ